MRRLFCLPFALAAVCAHACAVCQSPTGQQVRAGLFNGHFLHTLALVLVPFPVFAGILGLLAAGFPRIQVVAGSGPERVRFANIFGATR